LLNTRGLRRGQLGVAITGCLPGHEEGLTLKASCAITQEVVVDELQDWWSAAPVTQRPSGRPAAAAHAWRGGAWRQRCSRLHRLVLSTAATWFAGARSRLAAGCRRALLAPRLFALQTAPEWSLLYVCSMHTAAPGRGQPPLPPPPLPLLLGCSTQSASLPAAVSSSGPVQLPLQPAVTCDSQQAQAVGS